MKCNWQIKKMEEIAYFNPRETLKKGTVAKKVGLDKLEPFCRDIKAYEYEVFSGGSKFRNGDTIMARITPCLENGKVAQVNVLESGEIGFGSTEYIVFRAKEGVDEDYLYYLVCSPIIREPAIKSMVGSSGRQRVQTSVVQDLNIEIPPIKEQKVIAKILKGIDDKISLNKEINNNLEQQALELYRDHFITMRHSNRTTPKNWNHGTVSEIIELHNYKRIPLSSRERAKLNKIYPYYGATSIVDYVDKYLFDGIYLLIGEDGTVIDSKGYPIVQYIDGKFWVNNHAHIITGKNGFSVEMLYLLFKSTNIKSFITGAVQPKISQANLRKIPVIIPSVVDIKDFDLLIQPIFSKIRNHRFENYCLSKIRDILLPKLLSGELDVSNIDI